MGYVKSLIILATEYLKWKTMRLELDTRTLILDKVREVERHHDELEEKHKKLHDSGKHADAERVLDKQVEYACFRRGILDLGKRADIYSKAEGDVRGPRDSREKRPADPQPVKIA